MGWVARNALPGLRSVAAQVGTYAAHWEEANRLALEAAAATAAGDDANGTALWAALGDSTAQGVGAPSPERGYVGQLAEHLRRQTGQQWLVLNLSRSGARVIDVLDVQLPRLEALASPHRLVTCAVGANDLVRRTPEPVLVAHFRQLMARLPAGSVIATLPQGLRPALSVRISDLVRAEAPAAGLVVADVWATTAPPWAGKLAADGFHPGVLGYADWARAFELALADILTPGDENDVNLSGSPDV